MRLRHWNWAILVVGVCGASSTRGSAQDAPSPAQVETLIKDLQTGNVDARRSAAMRVRLSDRMLQRKTLPMMIDLLKKERDGQVRLAVLDALAALGPDAASAVPALLETLRTDVGGKGEEAQHQDYRSALALAAIGKPAVDGLLGLLKERKESVRAETIMSLGRIGPDAETAVPALVPLLGDKNERIRHEAALALGRIGNAAAKPLIAACGHKDAVVRARAVESLGYLADANNQVHVIVITCGHDDVPEVRASALKALARFKVADNTLAPIVKENLHHDDEAVRLAVVNLLVERRALLARMAPDLEALLTSENDRVSRNAAFLLGKIGSNAAPRLIDALHHKSSRIDQIAEALAQVGRPAVEVLQRALNAPEPRVRRGAALALGQIRPVSSGTVRSLGAGLGDSDPDVKLAFLIAIGYLGPRADECVPAVRGLLRDKLAEIRIQAIRFLSQSAARDERLLGDLIALVNDDGDARVQRQAIDTIRSLGPAGRKALPAVIGKLASTNTEVRLAAAEMIGTHGQAASDAVPALGALLDDPSPKLRTIVAQTLGKLGKAAQPAFARLTPLLGAEQVEVREAAALTLGSLELDAEVIRPHLAKALRDKAPDVRRAAMKTIQRFGPQGAIFVPDIILLAESKENLRSVERMLRRFERKGPDVRSLPELVKQLDHNQDSVRLLAIKFLGLAGPSAKEAIPALERMSKDPSAEVRKQAEAASKQIRKGSPSSRQESQA